MQTLFKLETAFNYIRQTFGWMYSVTKLDRITNETIRGTPEEGELSKKLKWYRHVMKTEVVQACNEN